MQAIISLSDRLKKKTSAQIEQRKIDKEMKTKCCYSPSDAMRGQAAERIRKLITNAKKVAIGEYIVGERVLVAFE